MLNIKNTQTKKNISKLAFQGSVFLVIFFFVVVSRGYAATDNSISQIDQTKLEELNARAAAYRGILDIKKKQSEMIGNKISSMTSNIQDVQVQITDTETQIDALNVRIEKLETQINEKKALIASQKELLVQIIQSYYQITQTSPVAIYLADDNLASFMVNKDRVSQTGDRINQMIETLNNLKADIQKQSDELANRKSEIVSAHEDLQAQHNNFETIKKQQTSLLVQTQGDTAKYTQLLKNIEEQKNQLLNFSTFTSSSFSLDGLSVGDYLKKHQPASSLFASTSWYFSQTDLHWASMTIGKTKTLMGDYGCAVTSLAMVFKEHGGSVTPGILAKQSIFSGDLINWPNTWDSPRLNISNEGKSHKNINWSTIDSEIARGNPVIVYIGRSGGSGGHYVVIHHKASGSDYVVHDPYFGANIYLSSSRALIGAMGSSSATYVDQMIVYN